MVTVIITISITIEINDHDVDDDDENDDDNDDDDWENENYETYWCNYETYTKSEDLNWEEGEGKLAFCNLSEQPAGWF